MVASQPLSSARAGQPGPVEGLLLGVAGQHAVADRHAGVQRDPGEPGGDRVADVLEVRRAAADDHAERDDGVVPLRPAPARRPAARPRPATRTTVGVGDAARRGGAPTRPLEQLRR